MRIPSRFRSGVGPLSALTIACLILLMMPAVAPAKVPLLVVGDSISEGVQSFDANIRTQPNTYGVLLAQQMGVALELPLIRSGPRGMVGDTAHRSRLRPYLSGTNLAVSGADVTTILAEQAAALSVAEITTETELVLFPRTGSQIEVAESLGAELALCWIGNNDVLGAAIAYDQMDASQLTSVADFQTRYSEIVQRLDAVSDHLVVLNIPNVTDIGFLMDRNDLIYFLGSDFGLPEGSYTSMMVMLMIRLGIDDGSLMADPNYVLDTAEIALIQARLTEFNQIIAATAAAVGAPLVDVNKIFADAVTNPYQFYGITLSRRLLGGLFSLDGVHPSNIAHAIVTNELIALLNTSFGMTLTPLSQSSLDQIFLADPFVDKDGDGLVTGRRYAGVLETLGPALGLSGDRDDAVPQAATAASLKERRDLALRQLLAIQDRFGEASDSLSKNQMIGLFKSLVRY